MKINLISKLLIFSLIFLSINLFSAEAKGTGEKPYLQEVTDKLEKAFNNIMELSVTQFKKLSPEKQSELYNDFIREKERAKIVLSKQSKDPDYTTLQSIYDKSEKYGEYIEFLYSKKIKGHRGCFLEHPEEAVEVQPETQTTEY